MPPCGEGPCRTMHLSISYWIFVISDSWVMVSGIFSFDFSIMTKFFVDFDRKMMPIYSSTFGRMAGYGIVQVFVGKLKRFELANCFEETVHSKSFKSQNYKLINVDFSFCFIIFLPLKAASFTDIRKPSYKKFAFLMM